MNVKVKQRIPLKIKKMGINGEGIGFYKKTLVFVPGALKGEEVYCGMQEPLYYRAKLQFQTRKYKDEVKAGLYAQNSHYLVSLKNCLVQD